jgi:hypothetical protein
MKGRITVYEEVRERYKRDKEMDEKLKRSSSSDYPAYQLNENEVELDKEKSLVIYLFNIRLSKN